MSSFGVSSTVEKDVAQTNTLLHKSRDAAAFHSENRFNLQRVSDSFTVHMTQDHH